MIAAAVVLVAALGGASWLKWGRGPGGAAGSGGFDPKRVAVMYFQDNSSGAQLGYLADGLTESLIQRLSEVNALSVVSESGVSPYRGTTVPADSIARALSAGTIVRGTVEADGDKFQVRVRLINGNDGEAIADESFEQPQANVVAAQDSLAAKVANMLRAHIGSEVAIRDARARTSNTAAWTTFQRGVRVRKDADARASANDAPGAERNFVIADSLFDAATKMDPTWVEPVVARSSLALARARASSSPIEARPHLDHGIAFAEQALARQPRNASALEMRGTLRYMKWAYNLSSTPAERTALIDGAESDLKASVEIDPTGASAWNALSTVYSQKDNSIGAKTAAQRAYEEDAYLKGTDEVLWKLYATSYDLQQFPDAVKYCEDGGRRFPENFRFVRCRLWLLTVRSVPPDPVQAWKDYAKLEKLVTPQQWKLLQLEARMLVSAGLARAGMRDSALKVLAGARPDPADDKDGELAGVEAFVRTLFGTAADTTAAFDILNRYVSSSPQHRSGLKNSQSWWWKDLKTDRRFDDLVAGAR